MPKGQIGGLHGNTGQILSEGNVYNFNVVIFNSYKFLKFIPETQNNNKKIQDTEIVIWTNSKSLIKKVDKIEIKQIT